MRSNNLPQQETSTTLPQQEPSAEVRVDVEPTASDTCITDKDANKMILSLKKIKRTMKITYVFEDVLRRVLRFNGYHLTHVQNVTDVGHMTTDEDEGEDKMEKAAREQQRSPWEIARFYEEAAVNDFKRLNIERLQTARLQTLARQAGYSGDRVGERLREEVQSMMREVRGIFLRRFPV